MTWVLIVAGAWVAVAAVTALAIGRTVHTADVIEHTDEATTTPAEPHGDDVPPAAGMAAFAVPLLRKAAAGR
jgi:hypothetical protein